MAFKYPSMSVYKCHTFLNILSLFDTFRDLLLILQVRLRAESFV